MCSNVRETVIRNWLGIFTSNVAVGLQSTHFRSDLRWKIQKNSYVVSSTDRLQCSIITTYLLSKVWSNISMRKHFVKVLNLPGSQPTWSRGQTTGSCEHHVMADCLLGGRKLYILPRNTTFSTVKVSNINSV